MRAKNCQNDAATDTIHDCHSISPFTFIDQVKAGDQQVATQCAELLKQGAAQINPPSRMLQKTEEFKAALRQKVKYSGGALACLETSMSKVYKNATEALAGLLRDDMTIAAGGFGLCGIPEHCIEAIKQADTKGLTIVSNNAGVDGFGLGKLMEKGQIKKMISSYVGENKLFAELFLSGKLEVEFNPQGTLAERMRAGGAGIAGFYTKTGVGTVVAEGKEVREFDGQQYVLERGIVCDLSIVKAWKGDEEGNLVYRKTARNFNPMAATCGRVTVAEVEQLVPVGQLVPDMIHTPGIFVQRILKGEHFEKRIEQRTTRAA